jgi:hypothetical protein
MAFNINLTGVPVWDSFHKLPSGDTQLVILVSIDGVAKYRKTFTATAGGRVLNEQGMDIGPVPGSWAAAVSSFNTAANSATTALESGGHLNP